MLTSVERSLSYYTKKSTTAHVVFLLIGIVFSYTSWFKSKELKNANIYLVKSSVRVDVVAMPKMTLKELKAFSQSTGMASSVKNEIADDETQSNETSDIEFEKAKKKVSFKDLMKRLANKKIEKAKKTKKKKKKKKSSRGNGLSDYSSELKQLVVEGNQLSKGSSLIGDSEGEENEIFGNYLRTLRDQVRENWKLPSYLLDKDLRCRVRVYISQEGKLIRAKIFESSGNSDYDNKALEAVKFSSPFSMVGNEIVTKVGRGEILLGFPL